MRAKNAIIMKAVQIKDRQVAKSYLILLPKLIQNLYNKTFFDKPRHVWRHTPCRGFLLFIKTVNEYIQKLHDRICYI